MGNKAKQLKKKRECNDSLTTTFNKIFILIKTIRSLLDNYIKKNGKRITRENEKHVEENRFYVKLVKSYNNRIRQLEKAFYLLYVTHLHHYTEINVKETTRTNENKRKLTYYYYY